MPSESQRQRVKIISLAEKCFQGGGTCKCESEARVENINWEDYPPLIKERCTYKSDILQIICHKNYSYTVDI